MKGASAKGNVALPTPAEVSTCFSERLILVVLAFVCLIFLDPFYGGRLYLSGFFKYFPLVLLVGALTFNWVGGKLFGRYVGIDPMPVLRAAAPIGLLGLMIIVGSIYGVRVKKIENSFLSVGITMPFFVLSAYLVYVTPARDALIKRLVQLFLLASLGMAALMVATLTKPVPMVFHEEIFIAIPFLVYFFVRAGRLGPGRVMAGLFFLGMAILSRKNTAYLLALLSLGAVAFLIWWPRIRQRPGIEQALLIWSFVILCAAAAAGIWYVLEHRQTLLQSGNTEYRFHMYKLMMKRFYRSPLWGTGFSEPTVEFFDLYKVNTVTQTLPTHSDVIDLVANGGIVAVVLWVIGHLRLVREFVVARTFLPPHMVAPIYTLVVIGAGAILTYAFNPLMQKPLHSTLMWISLGAILGYCMHLRRIHAPAPVRRARLKTGAGVPA